DSLILCKFLRGVFTDLFAESADLLRCVTGWDVTPDELRAVARRIVTAKKLFNIREGWTPEEDTLPARFFADGTLPRERLEAMKRAYYQARGWQEHGWVQRRLADELRVFTAEDAESAERAFSALSAASAVTELTRSRSSGVTH